MQPQHRRGGDPNATTVHREVTPAHVDGGPGETVRADIPDRALVADDGAIFVLDRPYVIGRQPMLDDTVRTGMASPIALREDARVSRVHAYVWAHGDAIWVRDAGTPAGTFIAAPGAADWTRIAAAPAELKPGWSVRIGGRILTYRKV